MLKNYRVPVSFVYEGYVNVQSTSAQKAKALVESSFDHAGNPSFVGSTDITDWEISLPATKNVSRALLIP